MIKKNIEILKIFLLLLYIYHFASVFHRCNTKKNKLVGSNEKQFLIVIS